MGPELREHEGGARRQDRLGGGRDAAGAVRASASARLLVLGLASLLAMQAYGAQLRVDVLLSRSESEPGAAALQPGGGRASSVSTGTRSTWRGTESVFATRTPLKMFFSPHRALCPYSVGKTYLVRTCKHA